MQKSLLFLMIMMIEEEEEEEEEEKKKVHTRMRKKLAKYHMLCEDKGKSISTLQVEVGTK